MESAEHVLCSHLNEYQDFYVIINVCLYVAKVVCMSMGTVGFNVPLDTL